MRTNSSPDSQIRCAVRVLIVDDMPQVRQDLRLLLQLSGKLEVVGEAADGNEAVAQVDAQHPDVVVMDLEMPRLDGCEATRRIKASRLPCRVIALTVHGEPAARERAKQAGVDDFVEKGAPTSALVSAIMKERSY